MKRHSPALSQPRPRSNMRAHVFLILLMSSGMLGAVGADAPTPPVDDQVHSAPSPLLAPGTSRELSKTLPDGRRLHYRIEMDTQGNIAETYTEDGRDQPVDDAARAWLRTAGMPMLPVPPLPPAPPSPPSPPSPPAPPPPPAPPTMTELPAPPTPPGITAPAQPTAPSAPPVESALSIPPAPPAPPSSAALPVPPTPPAIHASAEFKVLLASLGADARVSSLVGDAPTMDERTFDGSLHLWDQHAGEAGADKSGRVGKAEFSMVLNGTKGRAMVRYAGKLQDGTWQASRLELTPLAR